MNFEEFRSAIRSAGLNPPEVIEPGRLYRFSTNGRSSDDAGWCKLFGDCQGGVFGDFRSGMYETWQAQREKPFTSAEREAFRQRCEQERLAREAEKQTQHQAAAAKAAEILAAATMDPVTHPYASRKQVPFGTLVKRGAWPQRGWPDALLTPVYGGDGGLWSIEAVNTDGDKDFLAGGRISGGFHPFGKVRRADRVLIGEGLASVAACVAADPSPAVAALSASNLKAVAMAVRELAPEADIILVADNDVKPDGGNPGLKAAEEAAAVVGARLALPRLGGRKCDFWDLWDERGVEAVREAIADAKGPGVDGPRPGNGAVPGGGPHGGEESRLRTISTHIEGDDGAPRRRPQTDVLIDIGLKVPSGLFRGDDDRPYAVITDSREVWPIASRRFREWLQGCYFKLAGRGANSNALRDATGTIAAHARFGVVRRKVFLRTAEADDKLYVDLSDDGWRVVEIDATGWRVLDRSPVMFTRRGSPAPLPIPEPGGSMSQLWPFLNVPEKARPLAAAWLLAALCPLGPYPILMFQGEEATAKSTTTCMLRSLCDPSLVPLRAPTRDEKDFLVGAVGNWCVCIDNVSGMQPWLSDSLCRLSTGGGFAARTLYTDCDETAIQIQRPVILNGIDVGAARGDLVSRTITVELEVIPEDQRMREAVLMAKFDKAKPRILGVLCTALSQALREKQNVELERRPRMADFATLAVAAETALGFEPGAFMRAYDENIASGTMAALESSPVARAIIQFMGGRSEWTGTATELLDLLAPKNDDRSRSASAWPMTGRGMTGALNRLAPALRRVGIHVEHLERAGHARTRRLRLVCKVPAQPSEPSASVKPSCDAGSSADGSNGADDPTVRRQEQPSAPAQETSQGSQRLTSSADGADGPAGTLHTWGTRL
jgi:phage/plasmid primase-like uncharacterized protein